MKRSYISFIILALAISVCAQAPLSFKYQAYLRNADGTIRGSEFVTLQLEIVQGTVNGTTIYSEVHNTSTNAHGLVSVSVGDGSTSSNMSAVQWESGPFFLDIRVNGIHLGTTELLSVPFALYANETGSGFSGQYSDLSGAPNLATVATSGNYLHLTNRPVLALVATTGSYTSLLNVPATFLPSVHTHLEADISNLAHYTDDSINGAEAAFIGWDMDVADDFSGSYLDLIDIPPTLAHYTDDSIDGTEAAFIGWDMDVADDFSGSYLDLIDVPPASAHYTDDSIDGTEAAFTGWDMNASDDFVGNMGGAVITNLGAPIAPTDAATRAYVDASSGSFSGSFNDLTDVPANLDIDATDDFNGNMGGAVITNLGTPIAPTDAATRAYVDASSGSFSGSYTDLSNVPATFTPATHAHVEAEITNLSHYTDANIGGDETAFNNWDKDVTDDFTGDMGSARITNLGAPTTATDAVNRAYIDVLEARIVALETAVGILQSQVSTLQGQATDFESRISALETP
jgi:hypothetical protein